jgi:2-methylcitrate dehydratase PrpD
VKVPGNADNPMSWDEIRAKFRECASASAMPLPEARVIEAERLAARLEELPDATELIRCLA